MSQHKQRFRTYGATKTVQSSAQEVDVNRIVNRYMTPTGPRVPQHPTAHRQPIWGDWEPEDFQAQLNRIADAKIAFQSLPARLRARFGNQPYQLVRWVNDPKNLHEAIAEGLIPAPEGYEPPKKVKPPQQVDLEIEALRAELNALKLGQNQGGSSKSE